MTVHVSPEAHPALVLNADYRPLSYYPLSLWGWQDAIKAVFLERVNIVSEYDFEVRSPSFAMKLPSVVSLKTYIKPSRHPAFTRFNVFLRDRFQCQYCGAADDLTFDHLLPRSRGGHTTWSNVVTACAPCNLRKGNKGCREVKHVAAAGALRADRARPAQQRPAVPAQLSARELARLPLLGRGAGALSCSGRAPGHPSRRPAATTREHESSAETSTFHPANDRPRMRSAASVQLGAWVFASWFSMSAALVTPIEGAQEAGPGQNPHSTPEWKTARPPP